uniref:Cl345_1a n=1 Tax=Arundo donax TaxID=35708 RepID=A0A0A9F146_ARUDO
MERRGSHEADDGRAIRIRHNSTLPQPDIRHGLGVDLRYHKRHLGVQPERGAVVHHDGAAGDGRGREFPADAPAGAEERDVDAIERPARGEVLDGVLAVLEGETLPRGPLAGEEAEAAVGEVPVGDDAEELLAHRARGADDGHGGPVLAQRHADGGGRASVPRAARGRREEVRVADGGGSLHCDGGGG